MTTFATPRTRTEGRAPSAQPNHSPRARFSTTYEGSAAVQESHRGRLVAEPRRGSAAPDTQYIFGLAGQYEAVLAHPRTAEFPLGNELRLWLQEQGLGADMHLNGARVALVDESFRHDGSVPTLLIRADFQHGDRQTSVYLTAPSEYNDMASVRDKPKLVGPDNVGDSFVVVNGSVAGGRFQPEAGAVYDIAIVPPNPNTPQS